MKKTLLLLCILSSINLKAQDYFISFEGTGATNTVETVKVENLTKGSSLTLLGNDILRLNFTTGLVSSELITKSALNIFPNPMTTSSILAICPAEKGNAVISICELSGKEIAKISCLLENSEQSFNITGLKTGFYIVQVKGLHYQYSEKLICNGISESQVNIQKISSIVNSSDKKTEKQTSKGGQAIIGMVYAPGDRIKYTGISGSYSTVKTDIPTGDNTVTFNFIACTDADNNNYPIVEIGSQVWMAENLKTTKYSDGSEIPLVTDNTEWSALTSPAYCWYNNDAATYKTTYGGYYNMYAVEMRTNGGRNVCPLGWYPANDLDWTVLTTYLDGWKKAGSKLRETGTSHWISPNSDATNETGFTGLPGGYRALTGRFVYMKSYGIWWGLEEGNPEVYYGLYRDMNAVTSIVNSGKYSKQSGFSVRCIQGEHVTTSKVTSITQLASTSGGIIISDGGLTITGRGICWSTSSNPTISDNHTSDGMGIGTFTSGLTGLTINTTYFVRAYIINSSGITYGNEIFFSTKGESGNMSDIDGNNYRTIEIGNQIWMAENLRTTKYADGSPIPLVNTSENWSALTESSKAYCWYNDNISFKDTYGALYTWSGAMNGAVSGNGNPSGIQGVCPTGWHLPSDIEWDEIRTYLGTYLFAGGKMKDSGTTNWSNPNTDATNESGFSGLPSGRRNELGTFYGHGVNATWWSSTSLRKHYLSHNNPFFYTDYVEILKQGFSVRCVKD